MALSHHFGTEHWPDMTLEQGCSIFIGLFSFLIHLPSAWWLHLHYFIYFYPCLYFIITIPGRTAPSTFGCTQMSSNVYERMNSNVCRKIFLNICKLVYSNVCKKVNSKTAGWGIKRSAKEYTQILWDICIQKSFNGCTQISADTYNSCRQLK